MRQSVLIRRGGRARATIGPETARGGGPGRRPRVRAPGASHAGRGWGGVGHALHQGRPHGMQGAKGPSRDRSRIRTEEAARTPRTGTPFGAMPGMWRVVARRNAERANPPPMPDQPLLPPTVRGPIGRVACRRESAVILRRQRAPPGRFTIGEGLGFHKAAPPGLQPWCVLGGDGSPGFCASLRYIVRRAGRAVAVRFTRRRNPGSLRTQRWGAWHR